MAGVVGASHASEPHAWEQLCSYHMDLGQLDYDDKALAGMETFVSFVSVFYFNYCYTRFTSQYDRAMGCKDTICSLCVLASTALRRQEGG